MAEEPSPQAPPSPSPSSALSSSRALVVRPAGEVSHPVVHRGPMRLATPLREPSRGIASLPWASRLIMDGDWLRSALRSSLGEGLAPGRASGEACQTITRAPAPSPLPRGGVLIRGPRRLLGADDDAEDMLERAQRRRVLRQGFLRRAADEVSRLGEELADEDARLEAEGLRLAEERRKLEAAAALARHQRDLDNEEAEALLAASREARSRAVEESREADRRREASEERARELLARCHSLEQQAELRETTLASMKVASVDQVELLRREEALTLEAAERARDLERLETRERLVTRAEDDVVAREARVLEEVERGVTTARLNLERELEERLGLIRVEAEGRTAALRAKLEEATR